jgi:hypothetical protein
VTGNVRFALKFCKGQFNGPHQVNQGLAVDENLKFFSPTEVVFLSVLPLQFNMVHRLFSLSYLYFW